MFKTRDAFGLTPLSIAALFGAVDSASIVLNNDIGFRSANEADDDGRTPTMHAAMKDNTGVLQILLDRGVEVTPRDKFGYTALRLAVAKGKK
jgi:ankyrin repeat protein